MTETIDIRRVTAGDIPALAALSQRVFVATFVDDFAIPYDPDDLAGFLAKSHGEASFQGLMANPAVEIWVAESPAGLVGYAAAGPMTLPHAEAQPGDRELYRLYVDAACHGQGVAPRLMEAVGQVDWIGVWSGNIRARKFYARYGFEKAGEYDYPVGRTLDREFILRRKGIRA